MLSEPKPTRESTLSLISPAALFVNVIARIINLEDALLGMDAFSHGAFNRCRIIVNADELDKNLTSTREAVKDSQPFSQLKEYIKKKFNNEVRKYYFDQQLQMEEKKSVSSRMASMVGSSPVVFSQRDPI